MVNYIGELHRWPNGDLMLLNWWVFSIGLDWQGWASGLRGDVICHRIGAFSSRNPRWEKKIHRIYSGNGDFLPTNMERFTAITIIIIPWPSLFSHDQPYIPPKRAVFFFPVSCLALLGMVTLGIGVTTLQPIEIEIHHQRWPDLVNIQKAIENGHL